MFSKSVLEKIKIFEEVVTSSKFNCLNDRTVKAVFPKMEILEKTDLCIDQTTDNSDLTKDKNVNLTSTQEDYQNIPTLPSVKQLVTKFQPKKSPQCVPKKLLPQVYL